MTEPANLDLEPRDARRLTGWKEIAGYFDKGVRTAQRWEAELGLPVRYIGVGEGLDDMQPFDAKEYIEAIFG